MSRHNCPGEDCHRCQALIDDREFGDQEPDYDLDAAQDQYERATGL